MENITITKRGISQVFFMNVTDSGKETTYMRTEDGAWWQFVNYFLTCSFKLVERKTISMLETSYQQWKNNTNDSPKKTLNKG